MDENNNNTDSREQERLDRVKKYKEEMRQKRREQYRKARDAYKSSDAYQQQKEKQREQRREAYKMQKERLKAEKSKNKFAPSQKTASEVTNPEQVVDISEFVDTKNSLKAIPGGRSTEDKDKDKDKELWNSLVKASVLSDKSAQKPKLTIVKD